MIYEELPVSPPDPEQVDECEICGNEIYRDELYYETDDYRIICQNCLDRWALEHVTTMFNGREEDE